LDSDGKAKPGSFGGAVNWIGAYDQCNGIETQTYKLLLQMDADIPIGQDTVRLKFKGQYMSIRIWAIDPGRNNAYTPFDIGACVPDSCSEDDIRRYMTYGEKSVVPIEVYNG
ncbi:unnamed protein product, partial [Owenia fusiformis]